MKNIERFERRALSITAEINPQTETVVRVGDISQVSANLGPWSRATLIIDPQVLTRAEWETVKKAVDATWEQFEKETGG